MRFREIYENLNKVYSFSSLQLNFNNYISSLVLQFSNIYIKDSYLYFDDDGGCGRENQIHCTVLYGIESSSSYKIRKIVNKFKEFSVTLNKITFFEQENCDVMKIDVDSDYLHEMNSIVKKNVDYQNNYKEYVPHCTIAYLKKGIKENLKFDENHFIGLSQTVYDLEFSSKDGSRELIKLKGNLK
jgi:hypothetical protein